MTLNKVGDQEDRYVVSFATYVTKREDLDLTAGFLDRAVRRLNRSAEIAHWQSRGWTPESVPNPEMMEFNRSFNSLSQAQDCANSLWEELKYRAHNLKITKYYRAVVIEEGSTVVTTYGPVPYR